MKLKDFLYVWQPCFKKAQGRLFESQLNHTIEKLAIDFKKWCIDNEFNINTAAQKSHSDKELFEIFLTETP